jgi:hypothetical protein
LLCATPSSLSKTHRRNPSILVKPNDGKISIIIERKTNNLIIIDLSNADFFHCFSSNDVTLTSEGIAAANIRNNNTGITDVKKTGKCICFVTFFNGSIERYLLAILSIVLITIDGVVKNIIKNIRIYKFRYIGSMDLDDTYHINDDKTKPMTNFTHRNIFPKKEIR